MHQQGRQENGTIYGYGEDGVQVMASPDTPLPYGHPNLSTFFASQLVRAWARSALWTWRS
ncbi:hypothetical protein QEP66_10405 [Streptomyces sp. LB8]|nr:hypothetical protein [Streptomyces sp. LB8]